VSTPIEGESPIDFYLGVLDKVNSFTDEYTKDRSLFFAEDFSKYEINGEILTSEQFVKKEGQLLRKYRYQ